MAANVVNYTDSPLAAGNYEYRVRASNSAGNSGYSNTDPATVTAPVGARRPLRTSAATVTGGNPANLTWTDNSSNETGFRVERKVGAGSFATLATKAAGVTSHADPGLTADTTYTYRVIATGTPDSAPSNEVVVIIGNPVGRRLRAQRHQRRHQLRHRHGARREDTPTHANTQRNAFLRFSLAGVAATVTSAKLRLYGNAVTSAKATNVHSVADITWVETHRITWNTPPPTPADRP